MANHLIPPAGARPHAALNGASRAFAAACGVLFALPLAACLVFRAGFLDLANEPLAYRYFYTERVIAGDPVVVGVGYLVGLVHRAVYAAMLLLPKLAGVGLDARLDFFALATNGVLTAMMAALCVIAAVASRLRPVDRALFGLAVLMPLYGTGQMGFDFCLQADYPFLDIVLCAATVLVFQFEWAAKGTPSRRAVVLAGGFIGLAMANKITMLVGAGVVAVPVVAFPGVTRREFTLRVLLAAAALAAAFLLVHAAYYGFDLRMLRHAIPVWLAFVSNPGGQTGFWRGLFQQFLESYSYGDILLYSAAAATLALVALALHRAFDLRVTLATAFCLLGALASAYFVVKRPAGTTLYESTMFAFVLSVVLATMAAEARFVRMLVLAACIGWPLRWIASFPLAENVAMVAGSRPRADAKWRAFREARRLAGTRPMIVVIPDNSFHHEGVFELLLKGASDFPTWNITSGKRSVLDRYAPGMSFRDEYSGPKPSAPYPPGAALVWFDRANIPPLTVTYPELAKAVARPGVLTYRWVVAAKDRALITMHLAVPPATAAARGEGAKLAVPRVERAAHSADRP